jgi:peptide chain release factor 2
MRKLDNEKTIIGKWDQLDELRESINVYRQFLEEGEDVEEELKE